MTLEISWMSLESCQCNVKWNGMVSLNASISRPVGTMEGPTQGRLAKESVELASCSFKQLLVSLPNRSFSLFCVLIRN